MQTSRAVETLERELRGIFGDRLQSLVAYGERARHSAAPAQGAPRGLSAAPPQPLVAGGGRARHSAAPAAHGGGHGHGDEDVAAVRTIATVATLTGRDLRACAGRVEAWHQAGLATPLV